MKIAYILPSLQNKGPVVLVRDLVSELVRRFNVECAVFYLDPVTEVEFECPVRLITSFKDLNIKGYDVVHAHLLRPDILMSIKKGKLGGAKLVSTMHNYMYLRLNWEGYGVVVGFLARTMWLAFLRRYDKVVCLSHDMRKFYSRFLDPHKLEVIYNGRMGRAGKAASAVPEAEMLRSLKENHVVIGTAANLRKAKGLEQLIRLLALSGDYALLIIGDGPEMDHLTSIAASMGVSDRCVFTGFRTDVFSYYGYVDVYAIPSRVEGLPLALLEAAEEGLPTVCSDIPVFKETFDPGEVAFYPLDDIGKLKGAVEDAIRNRASMSRNIRARFEACYTLEIMAGKYLDLYNKLA